MLQTRHTFQKPVRNPFCITTSWDDGHPLDLKIAELLDKHGLPGTFYIPLANKRPVLLASDIRSIAGTFEVGAHTCSHCDLSEVSDELSRNEIADCKEPLEQITGKPCTTFCFPFGRYRRKHLSLLREAGYRAARTVELMAIESPRIIDGIAVIPTTVQAARARFGAYERNALKRLRPHNLLRSLLWSKSDWLRTMETMLMKMIDTGGVFHLWGHSWEVDEDGQWAKLDLAFGMLAQFKDSTVRLSNGALATLSDIATPRFQHVSAYEGR